MKKQYQEEYSQVHVPTELLEKTKLAMKEEQKKIEAEKAKKVIPFGKVSMAAVAAIILLLIVPATTDMLRNDGESGQQKTQMYLSDKEDSKLQEIPRDDKNWLEELVNTIKEFFD